ncbi:GNAT family N-acetyltransferase [Lapidilactobacillus achengensis]|uniref:GNAT family N-acetyltransferase n=1 Tax=Lapidilactobacillus achengensis TaxID=2486000 RepID=A0ABW1UQM1_9LACO|nr:GNAT family protein [Lapidilactobacillus achengensis]
MKIELRSATPADIQPLFAIKYGAKADLVWMKYNGPYFRDPILTWPDFQKLARTFAANPHRQLIVVDQRVLGEVTAHWEDGDLHRWLEVGIAIYDQHFWGQGIATQALQQWLTYLFRLHPDLAHIGLTTWSGNPGMIRVSAKAGLKQEGVIRKVRYWQGTYYDSVKFGILRDERQ